LALIGFIIVVGRLRGRPRYLALTKHLEEFLALDKQLTNDYELPRSWIIQDLSKISSYSTAGKKEEALSENYMKMGYFDHEAAAEKKRLKQGLNYMPNAGKLQYPASWNRKQQGILLNVHPPREITLLHWEEARPRQSGVHPREYFVLLRWCRSYFALPHDCALRRWSACRALLHCSSTLNIRFEWKLVKTRTFIRI
jgi:hypothetical protein